MIKHSLIRAVGFLLGFVVVFSVLYVIVIRDQPEDVGPIRPLDTSTDPATALIEEHDCWAETAPADVKMPGHVVVTIDGRAIYGGPTLVSQALAQVFNGDDQGLIVNAFCR